MSRYETETDTYRIVVGWDDPLQTFFVQVYALNNDEDADDDIVMWRGAAPDDKIATFDELNRILMEQILPIIDDDIKADLQRDQKNSKPPSPLQTRMRRLFGDKG